MTDTEQAGAQAGGVSFNMLARQMQRAGAPGTEEDLEQALAAVLGPILSAAEARALAAETALAARAAIRKETTA